MAQRSEQELELSGVKTFAQDLKTAKEKATGVTGVSFNEKAPADAPVHTPKEVVKTQNAGEGLRDSENVFDVSRAFTEKNERGTIINDKRTRHSRLGTIISGAFKEWLGDTKDNLKKIEVLQKKEPPKISPVKNREQIVKEAGALTIQAPRDDHEVIVEKLKTMKQDAERVTGKPFTIKQAAEEPKPTWTHIVEEKKGEGIAPTITAHSEVAKRKQEEKLDLRKQAVAPAVTKRAPGQLEDYAQTKEKPQPQMIQSSVPAPEPQPTPSEAPKKAPTEEAPAPLPVAPEKPKDEARAEAAAPLQPIPVSLPQRVSSAPTQQIVSALKKRRETTSRPKKRAFPIRTLILVGVLLICSGAGVLAAVLLIGEREPQQEIREPSTTSVIRTDAQLTLPLQRRNELLTALAGALKSAPAGITVITPMVQAPDGQQRAATAQEFFELLEPRVSGAFIRALEPEFTIGSVTADENHFFMIVRSNAFDTLFAGMIEWEANLQEDLAPLLGEPTLESLDLRSGEVRPAQFVDRIVQNGSVRILYDAEGNEQAIYAFKNRDTLVITETIQALQALLARL